VRPIVAVTGPDRRGYVAWRMTAYAIRRAGGKPRRVTPTRHRPPASVDAVVIGGGADVDPSIYGSTGDAEIDPARDALELELLARADAGQLPALGICRGGQLMNVFAGGTLEPAAYPTPPRWTALPRKPVQLAPGSRLRDVLGRGDCVVNSMHRNAIDHVGGDLEVSARDHSGVIQAVEDPTRRFWIGVQWHPEYLPQLIEQRRLFRALVGAARGEEEA
jgi:putative glutamine amidotransferase